MIVNALYPSLLYGVSQQVPRERVNGQLTEQLNMLSDPVTGLRRRPGFIYSGIINETNLTYDSVYSQYMELNDKPINIFVNTKTGRIIVTDSNFNILFDEVREYLRASNASCIRATNSFGLGWILNTEQKPVPKTNNNLRDPSKDGFLSITTGAFLKAYQVNVVVGSTEHQIVYTTPTGENEGDAGKSNPEGIAKEFETKFREISGIEGVYREGSTIFITSSRGIKVSNLSGSNYASASNTMTVDNSAMLPARLPKEANNAIVGVGTTNIAMQYYRWDFNSLTWKECGSYGSITSIENMPLELKYDGTITVNSVPFEGRIAGDDENNPYPTFIKEGISGLGTFMGRLVLLSSSTVCLGASKYPTRFMRSTVTNIIDSDPVEVSVGTISAASFEYCVQFNKDLVVFASTHQAVIPTGNNALTPTTAMLVLTSEQSIDTTAKPCVVGKTLMYSSPLSDKYFGIGELTPSEYTSSIYTPQNLTDHIPHYLEGRCRHIVSGGSINVSLMTGTAQPKKIYVHEYFWSGSERQLMSWHEWIAPLPVCSVHFSKDKFIISMKASNGLVITTLDPRSAQYLAGTVNPFIDCSVIANVVNGVITVPEHLLDDDMFSSLVCTNTTPGLEGEPVGITISDARTKTVTVNRSYKNNTIRIGWSYLSSVVPNAPVVTNTQGRIISDEKSTLVKSTVTVQNSGEFFCDASDSRNTLNDALIGNKESAVTWSSKELGLGRQQVSDTGDIVIPCRIHAHTANLRLYTSGTREMNILTIVNAVRLHYNKNRKLL